MIRRPPRSTLFPYTTLFRSHGRRRDMLNPQHIPQEFVRVTTTDAGGLLPALIRLGASVHLKRGELDVWRSEEHTSELQSRQYLVCRLLLEKKKNKVTSRQAT